MKKIIIPIFIVFSTLFAFGQNSQKNLNTALDYILDGYIEYGFQCIEKEASMNNIYAQYIIGVCYLNGIVVEQNKTEAFKWLRRSAERGLVDAMWSLSQLYNDLAFEAFNRDKSQEWENRFKNRGGKMTVPNIIDIYNRGLTNIENYALNPTSKNNNTDNSVASLGQSTTNTITIVREVNVQQNQSTQNTTEKTEETTSAKKSDVDIDIPTTSLSSPSTFALIIANENYHEATTVANAINDGKIFSEYCNKSLGIPAENIHFVEDATFNNIRRQLKWLEQIAMAYNSDASLIVYFAGHGMPDEATRNSFLIPIDGDVSDISTCYPLNDLYSKIESLNLKKSIVILDACFSGANRGDGMLMAARGVALKPKPNQISGNMVVLSATQEDETAYPFNSEGHGLFTYYLLKSIKESKGDITLGELYEQIKANVMKQSLLVNGKLQTPSINTSTGIGESWKEMTLN